MSFATLAVISLVAIVGPLLALPRRWHLPIILGELAAGIVLGATGSGHLQADNETFTFLADIGFVLIMFVVGAQVPVRDRRLRAALRIGVLRAVGVGLLSVPLALVVERIFGTGHAALYAVLMASSSAALILPIVDSLGLGGRPVLQMLPQVAVADAACIVALPLAIDPNHAGRAALGALAVLACAAVLFVTLRHLERVGLRRRMHHLSKDREFALELRISLAILFTLAALATRMHVSIMLAGFSFGLAVAGVGEPRRLAHQLFAVTEGFLGPLFFVWLGASLDLRELGRHPSFILLGGRARRRGGRNPCRHEADRPAAADRRIGLGAARSTGGRGDRRIPAPPPGTGRAGCADPRGASNHRGGQPLWWPGGSRRPADRSQPRRPARPSATSRA
jgi:Kef-type K+ transport system membrane component KefB